MSGKRFDTCSNIACVYLWIDCDLPYESRRFLSGETKKRSILIWNIYPTGDLLNFTIQLQNVSGWNRDLGAQNARHRYGYPGEDTWEPAHYVTEDSTAAVRGFETTQRPWSEPEREALKELVIQHQAAATSSSQQTIYASSSSAKKAIKNPRKQIAADSSRGGEAAEQGSSVVLDRLPWGRIASALGLWCQDKGGDEFAQNLDGAAGITAANSTLCVHSFVRLLRF